MERRQFNVTQVRSDSAVEMHAMLVRYGMCVCMHSRDCLMDAACCSPMVPDNMAGLPVSDSIERSVRLL